MTKDSLSPLYELEISKLGPTFHSSQPSQPTMIRIEMGSVRRELFVGTQLGCITPIIGEESDGHAWTRPSSYVYDREMDGA